MAKKKKRNPREKLTKVMDITKPITLEMLGTGEDPCFGKLYDPKTRECQRCGDSEFCAIALGQSNNLSRMKVEKLNAFKDIEEKDIKSKLDPKQAKKLVKARIYEMAKESGNKGIKVGVIADDIFSSFNKDGWRKSRAIKYMKLLEDKYAKISITKNIVKWTKPQ